MDHSEETYSAGKRMTTQRTSDSITCREALNLIALYLDAQASDHERTALQEHFETCRHCFDRAEFEQLLRERLRNLKSDISPGDLKVKINAILDNF
jgi:anti-sigma factor (TIGR02949 family)